MSNINKSSNFNPRRVDRLSSLIKVNQRVIEEDVNQKPHQDKRLSSLIQLHQGVVEKEPKHKPAIQKKMEPTDQQQGFKPLLKRAPRRPTYEREGQEPSQNPNPTGFERPQLRRGARRPTYERDGQDAPSTSANPRGVFDRPQLKKVGRKSPRDSVSGVFNRPQLRKVLRKPPRDITSDSASGGIDQPLAKDTRLMQQQEVDDVSLGADDQYSPDVEQDTPQRLEGAERKFSAKGEEENSRNEYEKQEVESADVELDYGDEQKHVQYKEFEEEDEEEDHPMLVRPGWLYSIEEEVVSPVPSIGYLSAEGPEYSDEGEEEISKRPLPLIPRDSQTKSDDTAGIYSGDPLPLRPRALSQQTKSDDSAGIYSGDPLPLRPRALSSQTKSDDTAGIYSEDQLPLRPRALSQQTKSDDTAGIYSEDQIPLRPRALSTKSDDTAGINSEDQIPFRPRALSSQTKSDDTAGIYNEDPLPLRPRSLSRKSEAMEEEVIDSEGPLPPRPRELSMKSGKLSGTSSVEVPSNYRRVASQSAKSGKLSLETTRERPSNPRQAGSLPAKAAKLSGVESADGPSIPRQAASLSAKTVYRPSGGIAPAIRRVPSRSPSVRSQQLHNGHHSIGKIRRSLPAPLVVKERNVRSSHMSFRPPSRKSGVKASIGSKNRSYKGSYYELEEELDDDGLSSTGSVILPTLHEEEKRFFELVAAGNVGDVEDLLAEYPHFNVNCVNFQNTSALQVAIKEKHLDMVDFLLRLPGIDARDAALCAIKHGDMHVLETVLHGLEETHPQLEFSTSPDSVEFADDMTPLMLAAAEGEFEMVDLLLERGHRMPDLHHPYCGCPTCSANLRKYDRLKYSQMKLNLYKAVANPTYLFHTTSDPILRAFELTGELQAAARMFPQLQNEYEEIWKSLRIFSSDLIGCCRDANEVELILNQRAGCTAAGKLIFPRLQLAIDLLQKEFVAHPNTQAVLEDAWTGSQSEWHGQSTIQQIFSIFPRIFMLPVIAVLSCCLPSSALTKKWNNPVDRLVSSFAAYAIFLILLFIQSAQDKTDQKRGPPATGVEGPIFIFVLGYFWSSVVLCFTLGPKRFFNTMWNWYDLIMQVLFFMTFFFWLISLADIENNGEEDLPRELWNAYDPTLISEGFLALGTIMAYCKLYMPMSLNYYLGPLGISIGKMTRDIFEFVFIFVVMVLAWSAALQTFYQPYVNMVQTDYASNSNTTQVPSFVSFKMASKTFFWSLFGMSPIEAADVVIENIPGGDSNDTYVINTHEFTEAIGYATFAVFQFLAVVVIMNMLVACMANTFTKVIDNVSIEWVYGRTKIYLLYMYQSSLPPPFNLIPTLSGLTTLITWLGLLVKSDTKVKAQWSLNHCCYIERAVEDYVEKDFPGLMTELAQRYLHGKSEESETNAGYEGLKIEIEELKDLIRGLASQLPKASLKTKRKLPHQSV